MALDFLQNYVIMGLSGENFTLTIGKTLKIIEKKRGKWRQIERREQANVRQNFWDGLSLIEKLSSLDIRLGQGLGAKKQRLKIHKKIMANK
jgi:hypothetical protein